MIYKKRTKYPFDEDNKPYESEYVKDDEKELTYLRRKNKDGLERELRRIDELNADDVVGDEHVLEQFESFIRNKEMRKNVTSQMYQQLEYIHRLCKMMCFQHCTNCLGLFDARWLLNCTEPKDCTFEGEKRFYVKPEEPIYITSKIVQTALDMSKGKGGQQ